MSKPLVSILSITYNHEKYVAEALESFVMQKTDFDYEVIIADDASPDNTQAIIRQYAEQYPEIIKPILREKNIGMNPNFLDALSRCQGKYIAMCEGDDYWTDPYKLQKQVDFLEGHPDYGLVYTDKIEIDEFGRLLPESESYLKQANNYREGLVFFDLLKSNFINTLSVVARREFLIIPDGVKYQECFFDWSYWLFVSMKTKVKFLNEKTCAYRKHPKGIIQSSKKDKILANEMARKVELTKVSVLLAFNKYSVFSKKGERCSLVKLSLKYALKGKYLSIKDRIKLALNTLYIILG